MNASKDCTVQEERRRQQTLKILFGSQGGTAEDVASYFQRQAKSRRFDQTLLTAIDDYPFSVLTDDLSPVLFVCSTAGQGEMPENMRKLWTFLCRKGLPNDALTNLRFAVVALGDSSYRQFNFAGKKLSRRLKQLGACEFCPIALADDQHELGPDAAIEVFEQQFWRVLAALHGAQNPDQPTPAGLLNDVENSSVIPESRYIVDQLNDFNTLSSKSRMRLDANFPVDSQNPFLATCLENIRLTPSDYFKDFRLIRLSYDSLLDSMAYVPGDVVMIQPQNTSDAVDEFLSNVLPHLSPTQQICITPRHDDFKPLPEYILPLNKSCTARDLARCYWDFQSVPRRSFFAIAQNFTPSERERERLVELSSKSGLDDLYAYCFRVRRTIAEVLQDFRELSAALTLEQLMELIPPLRPRAFSLASSPAVHRNELHILLSVVHYKTKLHRPRVGVCSSWLADDVRAGDTVLCWLRGGSIKFPRVVNNFAEQQQPCIMIGPGSGVAPFRSFIHERAHHGHGQNYLFFGNRNRDKDFLFQNEWYELCNRGMLHLAEPPAFSRDQTDKIYVQHRLRENGELVYRLLMDENAVLVMAGNAKMPAQVMDGLCEILQTHGGMKEDEARNVLATLEKQRRIQSETWS